MITTTSYGTWLPGDCRGYVQRGRILPAAPSLEDHARTLLTALPVTFTAIEQQRLFEAIVAGASDYGYDLMAVSIESWHAHWLIDHGFDPVARMVGRLKARMRQALDRGRIWTKGYDHRMCRSIEAAESARRYINAHRGARNLTPANP